MISIILYVIGAMNITRYAMISLWENLTQSASGASYPIPSPQHDLHHPFDRSRSCLRDRDMEKLVFCWFVLLTLLSLSSSATAQDTFPGLQIIITPQSDTISGFLSCSWCCDWHSVWCLRRVHQLCSACWYMDMHILWSCLRCKEAEPETSQLFRCPKQCHAPSTSRFS